MALEEDPSARPSASDPNEWFESRRIGLDPTVESIGVVDQGFHKALK